MSRAAQLRRFSIAFLGAVAFAGVIFVLINVALVAYASWRYQHQGSMTGFWAFFTALPPSVAAAIFIFFMFSAKLRPAKQRIQSRTLRKSITVAAVGGFVISTFWFLLETRFEALQESWIVWWAERITCPFWARVEYWLWPAILNATLYGFGTYFLLSAGRTGTTEAVREPYAAKSPGESSST